MKTVVEWLVEEMFKQGYLNDKPLTVTNIEHFVKQAKQMEKEQMQKICFRTLETCEDLYSGSLVSYFDELYNEIFINKI